MLFEIGFDLIKMKFRRGIIKKHVFSLSNECFWIVFESFSWLKVGFDGQRWLSETLTGNWLFPVACCSRVPSNSVVPLTCPESRQHPASKYWNHEARKRPLHQRALMIFLLKIRWLFSIDASNRTVLFKGHFNQRYQSLRLSHWNIFVGALMIN